MFLKEQTLLILNSYCRLSHYSCSVEHPSHFWFVGQLKKRSYSSDVLTEASKKERSEV